MMRKYIFVGILIFSLCYGKVFAQEAEDVQETESMQDVEEEVETIIPENEKQRKVDIAFNLNSLTYINQLDEETKKISAPTPIIFSPSIGVNVPNYTMISVAPTIYFYSFYYQWANGMAVPAEIENRTATMLSFLVDVPIVFNIYLKKSKIQFGLGPAALLRFGFLAGGVDENDYGFSGTAADDVKEINSFFWDKMRFFYVSASASWMFDFYKTAKAGPSISAFIPIGSLIADEGINGMMASIGLKVSF